jgi:hypothetical protein
VNSLTAPQEVDLGDQLKSNNGSIVQDLLSDGSMALHRRRSRVTIRASIPLGHPAARQQCRATASSSPTRPQVFRTGRTVSA